MEDPKQKEEFENEYANFLQSELKLQKALDEFRGEIDSVRPCDCVRLQREILKGIDICKLLHDGSVVRLDDAFKISDKTASVVEFDGYLVVANIFRVSHMKHFRLCPIVECNYAWRRVRGVFGPYCP